jgi:hypothetical protein
MLCSQAHDSRLVPCPSSSDITAGRTAVGIITGCSARAFGPYISAASDLSRSAGRRASPTHPSKLELFDLPRQLRLSSWLELGELTLSDRTFTSHANPLINITHHDVDPACAIRPLQRGQPGNRARKGCQRSCGALGHRQGTTRRPIEPPGRRRTTQLVIYAPEITNAGKALGELFF